MVVYLFFPKSERAMAVHGDKTERHVGLDTRSVGEPLPDAMAWSFFELRDSYEFFFYLLFFLKLCMKRDMKVNCVSCLILLS